MSFSVRASVVFLWLTAPVTGLLAQESSPRVEGLPPIQIGVDSQDAKSWVGFQNFLNEQLSKRKADFTVKLVPDSRDNNLTLLLDKKIQGAILTPFRYVIASLQQEKAGPGSGFSLDILAQLRRVRLTESQKAEVRVEDLPNLEAAKAPVDAYRSIIIMRRDAGKWPPTEEPITFRYSSLRSTSSFVFPMALFSQNGWVGEDQAQSQIKVVPDLDPTDVATVWKTDPGDISDVTDEELFNEFTKERKFDLLGTNELHYDRYIPEKDRQLDFPIVHRSDPIPFDPFVVVTSGTIFDQSKPESELRLRQLKDSLLATQAMTLDERHQAFPWTKVDSEETIRYRRMPDIHDWIPADDSTYDVVRKAAVSATGGSIIRLAVTTRVHRDISHDQKQFFQPLKRELLKRQERVFLDLQVRRKDELSAITDELSRGELDLAELPAFHATELVGKNFGLAGVSLFRDTNSDGSDRDYDFVILTRHKDVSLDAIDGDAKFAFTDRNSSSGFRWPMRRLAENGKRIGEKQLVDARDSVGVIAALLKDGTESGQALAADYGFMAQFEWERAKETFLDKKQVESIRKLKIDGAIPNAVLIARPGLGDDLDRYELAGEPKTRLGKSIKALVDSFESTKVLSTETGFKGYDGAKDTDWNMLQQQYDFDHPNLVGVFVAAILLVVIATGWIVYRATHDNPSDSPDVQASVSIEHADAEGLIKESIGLARTLEEFSDSTEAASTFGGKKKFETLREKLQKKTMTVLLLFDPKSGALTSDKADLWSSLAELKTVLDEDIKSPLEKRLAGLPRPDGAEEQTGLDWVRPVLETAKIALDLIKAIK